MKIPPRSFCLLLMLSLGLLLLTTSLSAKSEGTFPLTVDSLQNGKSVELSKLDWKYQPGDDPRFADPQFDDHLWDNLEGTIERGYGGRSIFNFEGSPPFIF